MAKFSSQVQQGYQARSERLKAEVIQGQQQQDYQQRIYMAKSDLESAESVKDYALKYERLSPDLKSAFPEPSSQQVQNFISGKSQYQEEEYRARVQQEATSRVNKRLRGRTIIFEHNPDTFMADVQKEYYRIIAGDPTVQKQIRGVAGLSIQAKEHGFTNVEDYIKISDVRKKQMAKSPSLLQQNIRQSTLIEDVNKLEVKETPLAEEPKQTFLKKTWGVVKKGGGYIGDFTAGAFYKDVSLQDYSKPTTTQKEEITERENELLKTFAFEKLVMPFVPLTLLKTIKFRQKEKSPQEEAITFSKKGDIQAEAIEGASGKLQTLEQQTELSPEDKEKMTLQVFKNLADVGVKTEITKKDNRNYSIKFSSKELSIDLRPLSYKQLEGKSKLEKTFRIGGRIFTEGTESFVTGYALGNVGALAKIGTITQKTGTFLKPIVKASPFFPLAYKPVRTISVLGLTTYHLGSSAYRGFRKGGTEGAILEGGISASKLTGLIGGGYFGSRARAEYVAKKVSAGGYTRNAKIEDLMSERKIQNYRTKVFKKGGTDELVKFNQYLKKDIPTERTGKVLPFKIGNEKIVKIKQADVLVQKIPDTKIKILSQSALKEQVISKKTTGNLRIKSVVSGLKGESQYTQYYTKGFIGGEGKYKGVVLATKTKEGVLFQTFRTKSNIINYKLLGKIGDKKVLFLDSGGIVNKIPSSEFTMIKNYGGTKFKLKNVNKEMLKAEFVKRFPRSKNALTSDIYFGEKPTAFARSQQIIIEDAKGNFLSYGSQRMGTLKAIIRTLKLQYKTGAISYQSPVKAPSSKLYLSTSPASIFTDFQTPIKIAPQSAGKLNINQIMQEITSVQSGTVGSKIAPDIISQISERALLGSVVIASAYGLRGKNANKLNLNLKANQINIFSENKKVVQQSRYNQKTAQLTKQTQLTQLIRQQIINQPITTTPPTTTSPHTQPFPPVVNFDLEINRILKSKKRKKGQKSVYRSEYTQDFTSKILGLEPMKIKQKDIGKLINKIQTGFEIRRGVKIIKR